MKCRAYTALLFGIAMFLGCGPTLQVKTDFDHAALRSGLMTRGLQLVWRAYCVAQGTDMADAALIQKAVLRALASFPPAAAGA